MTAWNSSTGWAVHLAPPLFSWFDIGAATIVLVIAGILLAGMIMFVRIASDDSERYGDLKEIVETLFGTPAHLRHHPEDSSGKDDAKSASAAAAQAAATPFSEPCPACDDTVTESDSSCPSCGLRLF